MTADDVRARSILIKFRGCLALATVTPCDDGRTGRCLSCGGTEFETAPYGWIECSNCHDFAFDAETYRKMMSEPHD